jgi:hypothetical protein
MIKNINSNETKKNEIEGSGGVLILDESKSMGHFKLR